MNKYELMFIVNPTLAEEDTKACIESFSALVAANGTVSEVNEWGKRKLAYPIEDLEEGYYVIINFESAPEFPAELDRKLKINDNIMRHLITRIGE